MMERLPAHPRRLPFLIFLGGGLAAVMLLGAGGGNPLDALQLLAGVLPVGDNGEGMLRVLLGRMSRTFILVSLALIIGISFALATTMMLGRFWRPFRVIVGWSSRFLGAVPPMAWALGLLLLLVQIWHLPVESLFPNRPAAKFDSWTMKAGRSVWYICAPALALAMPVYALALRNSLLRLDHLWKEGLPFGLRARGFTRSFVLWHHIAPRLWPHLVRLGWPLSTLLLAFSIVVEEVFMFKGWGHFMAEALRERNTAVLAAGCYSAGMMLAVWYILFALLEKPLASSGRLMPLRLPFHKPAWVAAAILLILLVCASWMGLGFIWWEASLAPVWVEISKVLALAALALVIVVAGLFSRWLVLGSLVCILLLPVKTALFLLLATALAVPEMLSSRMELKRIRSSDFMLASRMLGGPVSLSLWHHAIRCMWPMLAAGFFRMASAALVWTSILTFFGYGAADSLPEPSWGGLINAHSPNLLDEPLAALAPAMWVALWCLCFQWFARGFGIGGISFTPVKPVKSIPR